jgi:glycosyltransferase involved in cell wall biosynthesis
MQNKMKLSIVLPAKNEAASIGPVIGELKNLYPQAELIVVNDGSEDNTAELAEQAGARVISHPYSKGNGAAIKSGTRSCNGDVIVFMDADGQHQPRDVERLLQEIRAGYDLVVGARNSDGQASKARDFGNGIYNRLSSWMVGHTIEDLTSGMRAVRASLFKEVLYLLPNGFSYPTTSTMAFFRAGHSVKYIPIEVKQRKGKSHINLFKDGTRFFLIIFKVATLYSPLKIFFPASFFLFFVATGWYIYKFTAFNHFPQMSALLYSTSVVVFLMGLVSEQITSLMYKKD